MFDYKPSATIVAHSTNGVSEVITFVIELHRLILPQFNTHRAISKNFQSSRAIPIAKQIEMVRKNTAAPLYWGLNERGMVPSQEAQDGVIEKGQREWLAAMESAIQHAQKLNDLGFHKQIVNRLLEPFMYTKGVITGNRKAFEHFFSLRSHGDAQNEIRYLSDLMQEALNKSTPFLLKAGEYHLPFVKAVRNTEGVLLYTDEKNIPYELEDAIAVSVSSCAQVSYRMLDTSLGKANKIVEMLNLDSFQDPSGEPPHASPCEHQAKVEYGAFADAGNLAAFGTTGWWQYRKALEVGLQDKFKGE